MPSRVYAKVCPEIQFWSNHFVIGFYKAVRGVFSKRTKHEYAIIHQSPKPKHKSINLLFVELLIPYFREFRFSRDLECPFGNSRLIYLHIIAPRNIISLFNNDYSSVLNISNKMLRVIKSGKHMVRNIECVLLMNDKNSVK